MALIGTKLCAARPQALAVATEVQLHQDEHKGAAFSRFSSNQKKEQRTWLADACAMQVPTRKTSGPCSQVCQAVVRGITY